MSIDHLSKQALRLKKAWLMAAMWVGYPLTVSDGLLPNYSQWKKKDLLNHIKDLEYDFYDVISKILLKPTRPKLDNVVNWCSKQFDLAKGSGGPITLCTAYEFEQQFGPLCVRKEIEVPPYAELLFQGLSGGLAIRHPEYMLSRDLQCLYQLYVDAEALVAKINWANPTSWAGGASENAIGLGRSTVLACFNLLESFLSGIARTYCIFNPGLDEKIRDRLLSTQESLRKRVLSVPRQILGKEPPLSMDSFPLSVLFNEVKPYRNSFVHCEPGGHASKFGYVKEALFNSISPKLVEDAISSTESTIRQIWEAIYSSAGPRWLPIRDDNKRYPKQTLTVSPMPGGE